MVSETTQPPPSSSPDVLVFGGGIAGLWLLRELLNQGYEAILIEADRLGSPQSIASQGILHSGLKYNLRGLMDATARQTAAMPPRWRQCLAGQADPDLSSATVLSPSCLMWRTEAMGSKLGALGAKAVMHTKPRRMTPDERPAVLQGVPGEVFDIAEQVVDTGSVLAALSAPIASRLIRAKPSEVQFECDRPGRVQTVRLRGQALTPKHVVFAAGAGNAKLREQAGLPETLMQRRPLHMVMTRERQPTPGSKVGQDPEVGAALPMFYGHCVDGSATRVTVTANRDSAGRTVWQLGGQIAERGVDLEPEALRSWARDELSAVLPTLDVSALEWASYRVDRAERASKGGLRPAGVSVEAEPKGNVMTVWPTKWVLAPALAETVCQALPSPSGSPKDSTSDARVPEAWWDQRPRPGLCPPPWETAQDWVSLPEPPTAR